MGDEIRPRYYFSKEHQKECIEEMRDVFGDIAVYYFCLCNAYKYNYRAGQKPYNSASTDLKKATWYLDYSHKIKIRPLSLITTLFSVLRKRGK